MLLEVERGFLLGDLRPFATYLKSGYPLDSSLREKLIELIEGSGPSGHKPLQLEKKKPGAGNLIVERQKARRDYEIWDFVRRRVGETNLKTAIDEAQEKFGLKRAAIMKARSDCRQRLAPSSKLKRKSLD